MIKMILRHGILWIRNATEVFMTLQWGPLGAMCGAVPAPGQTAMAHDFSRPSRHAALDSVGQLQLASLSLHHADLGSFWRCFWTDGVQSDRHSYSFRECLVEQTASFAVMLA